MYKKALLTTGMIIFLGLSAFTGLVFAKTEALDVDLGVYNPKFNMMDQQIKKNPECLKSYIEKAELHLRFYQLEQAKILFAEALQLAKNEKTKRYLEGAILFCDLKLDEAIEVLDGLIQENQECKRATFIRGLIALQKNDNEKALKYFEKVLEIDANYLEAMNQIGWIYIAKADYDKAIEYFNQILYRDKYYISAVDGKGYALYKIGLHKEALPYINEVIILLPDNWGAWTTKGEIYFSKGEYYLSNYCLKKAEAINPDAFEVEVLRNKLKPIKPFEVKADKQKEDFNDQKDIKPCNNKKPCDKKMTKPCDEKKPCDKKMTKPCDEKKPCKKGMKSEAFPCKKEQKEKGNKNKIKPEDNQEAKQDEIKKED